MSDPVTLDLFTKVLLSFLGAALTCIGIVLVWGFQKLVTTLLAHSQELLKIEHRLGDIEKKIEPVDKLKGDLNNCFQRVKDVEERLEGMT